MQLLASGIPAIETGRSADLRFRILHLAGVVRSGPKKNQRDPCDSKAYQSTRITVFLTVLILIIIPSRARGPFARPA
eukprot:scaffold399457_cov35-Prasinocladus_malaysianus.AAC.2